MSAHRTPTTDACQEAIDAYRHSFGDHQDNAAASYAAGRAWELVGRGDMALAAYQDALSQPSAEPWLFLLNAVIRCAKTSGRCEETAVWLAKRAEASPPMPELGFLSGHLFRIVGQPERAQRILKACLPSISTKRVQFWATRELVSTLAALGRLEEAEEVTNGAIAKHPAQEGPLRNDLVDLFAEHSEHSDEEETPTEDE